jgi:hypothetical protein
MPQLLLIKKENSKMKMVLIKKYSSKNATRTIVVYSGGEINPHVPGKLTHPWS